jgi:NADPH:quinone reductase-like Zn-dependent oxidoreductase
MNIPEKMYGVVLTGHGGMDKLEWREDLDVPQPDQGEVLIKVHASSVNNTDINTRTAWYSKSVRGGTAPGGMLGNTLADPADGGWSGVPISFPRIQGADCCGEIVAVGSGVPERRIGERVLVRTLQSTGASGAPFATWTFGSECDGAFAQFAKTFSVDALPVQSSWTDDELASIPCAYSTAEGMLQRISLKNERVLITGASGGVGSAAIQLARRRGAHITAVTTADKAKDIRALGAEATIGRDDPFPNDEFDAVIDLVAGPRWPDMISALRRGGRYVTAGAIAGPIVELDVRTLYLRDLAFFGSTFQPDNILTDVIGYIEREELRPMIAQAFKLKDLRKAQETFLAKGHIGKIVIQNQ